MNNIGIQLFSQYIDEEYGSDDYVVTYSEEDESVLGWSVNIEKNGPQQPDVYFKIDKIDKIDGWMLSYSVLSKKILLLFGRNNSLSLGNRKIYKYSFTDKPKNTVPWEYSQINNIKIPNDQFGLKCSMYRTKLFLIVDNRITYQFDLLTMNLEKKYHGYLGGQITVNKNQTLLASFLSNEPYVYSMEGADNTIIYGLAKFITLKNTERLFICFPGGNKLVDPYQVYDEIDISTGFIDETNVITKLNRKIFIDNGNVCVTDWITGIDENKLQQLSKKIKYGRNSIYTLSTFKIIRGMLNEIRKREDIKLDVPNVLKDEVEIINLGLCKITYNEYSVKIEKGCWERVEIPFYHLFSIKLLNNQDLVLIDMRGIRIYTINGNKIEERYLWYNNEWKDNCEEFKASRGNIYDVNKHFKLLIGKILQNEFDDSKHSIPFPVFIEDRESIFLMDGKYSSSINRVEDIRSNIVEDVINDILVSLKFGIEMLKIAIKNKHEGTIQQIIESKGSKYWMTIISSNLAELCDYYPDFAIKYISFTSIILSSYCSKIGNSKNTSLHSYTNIYIKESNMDNIIFKFISELYNGLIRYLRIKEEIQTVSFAVPFPQICVYKDDDEIEDNHDNKSKIITILKKMITRLMMIPKGNSIWNEFLYKPKSILFCNIDSNHFYNWWNFAAIIDFKWKTFGRVYYYLIWLFYTIFYICYSLASTLEQMSIPDFYFKLLFIISIIFGSIFLIFEIRQCLWNYKRYFKDIWNLFVLGYAQAFFIVLRSNSINDDNDPRNVTTKYDFVNPDGTISNTTTMIQDPDSNTNLFNWFPTSLLAVYKLLTEEFLLQKAQIIMEIELFYMLPWQRNNKKWFPNRIYYDIPVTEIRKLINAIDNKQTVFNYPPYISDGLKKIILLTDDFKKHMKEKLAKGQLDKLEQKMVEEIDRAKRILTNRNDELKQQMERIMKHIGVEQDNKKEKDNEEQDNKLEKQIEQTEEKLTKQNVELKQQMERIMKYIGIVQDNEEEQDNKEGKDNEEEQDSEEEQDNKLEKQIEQTKEVLPKQNVGLQQQMDKLSQQMENIMELLLKRN
ncbi:hypothetical protein GLOIN_2v1784920 [Rhizophagus clarus]|uniref:Ion transport domain-containing protein n=1 Tax=Rhizophagus clarus TaxID=94130 RepID=A0A8H3QNI8_9GLOM|nr:hypothetical protein GLOIN_2v1784920 [Rhizophagus clarus]